MQAIPERSLTPPLIGPDSLTWKYIGDARFVLLGLSQAFIVQVAHPVISLGVEGFSTFRTDPHGRFMRSIALLWPAVYNTPAGQAEYGRRVRERHRDIKGVDASGKAWHALNPEPYLWVHMTALQSMVCFARCLGEPLDAAGEEQLFQEWLEVGQTLGIRRQDMPATLPEFWRAFDKMIDQRLERTETLDYLLRDSYFQSVPRPPQLSWLPQPLWRLVALGAGKLAYFMTVATLPECFRDKFQVPWTARDERRFRALTASLRVIWKFVPERLRWLPEARVAIVDARRHRENYMITRSPA